MHADLTMPLSGKTVLIVEDERHISMAIRLFLKKFSMYGMEAEDGHQAIEMLNEKDMDYVITDYRMPNMNGLELVHWIRKFYHKKDIPIIIFSGYTYDQIENHVDENTRVLYKPFIYMNLIESLALMENKLIDNQTVQKTGITNKLTNHP